ncbi:MAG: YdcF family protein [Chloroflexi bacterium]|nr:YdcF family protein [Chloroflexota bacterium]
MSAAGRPSVGATLAVVALAGLAGALALTAYATFRVWQRGEVDEAPVVGTADAIVVLGAAQYDGRPSPVLRARLDHAIALWRAGRAPILVTTGGGRAGDRTTEAAAGRAYAIEQGVPEASILMEDRGRSTQESLEAVAAILRARGAGPALFVSDPTHMLRVMRIAKDLGIDAHGSPASSSPSDATLESRLDATAHELGALAWYGLVGRTAAERQAAALRP